MPQAKTLTARELRRVLDSITGNPHSKRNRLMLLMTHWAGMRIGEVAALRIEDIRNADGSVKQEIRLDVARTKGKQPGQHPSRICCFRRDLNLPITQCATVCSRNVDDRFFELFLLLAPSSSICAGLSLDI